METKQIINGLLDRADRVADQSAGRIMKQAAERLRELDEKQRWIPVTERLPERNEDVLVCDTREDYISVWEHMCAGLWFDSEVFWATEDITHWMPLPEPPKEVDDG